MSSRRLQRTASDEEASETETRTHTLPRLSSSSCSLDSSARRSQRPTTGSKRHRDAATLEDLEAAIAHLEASPKKAPEKSDDESPRDRRDRSPCRPPEKDSTRGNSDDEGDGEDDALAEEAEAVEEIDAVLEHRRPAAADPAPAGSRHQWTKIDDCYLLLGVLEVGVGNWPRVLETIHARWHQLTWAKVLNFCGYLYSHAHSS